MARPQGVFSTTINISGVVAYTNFILPSTYRRGNDDSIGCVVDTPSVNPWEISRVCVGGRRYICGSVLGRGDSDY